MDFIGNDENMMLQAEVRQSGKCFAAPDDAARIVRIAEDQHSAFVIDNGCKLFEIHMIETIFAKLQRILDDLPAVAFGRDAEVVIDGRLDDDFFIRLGEYIDGETNAFDDARNEGEPVF